MKLLSGLFFFSKTQSSCLGKTELPHILQCLEGRYTIYKRNHTHNTFLHYLKKESFNKDYWRNSTHYLLCYFSPELALCISLLTWSPCNATQHRNESLQWIPKRIHKYILYLCDSWIMFRSCILFKSICVLWQNLLGAVVFGIW